MLVAKFPHPFTFTMTGMQEDTQSIRDDDSICAHKEIQNIHCVIATCRPKTIIKIKCFLCMCHTHFAITCTCRKVMNLIQLNSLLCM